MVHKSAHRGVHSGNTLRASNSRYSRRYHNQACIVSYVRADLLRKLAGGSGAGKADDSQQREPRHRNVAVDVALSLNKQSRWLLPSALKRQIDSNDIAGAGMKVSLLERHKLKRHANCVSFHSNMGAVKRIQPRNGRYFSFQFPAADGVSRRVRRRERREELEEHMKKYKVSVGKVVEAYTEAGHTRGAEELGESEVRYEVFYPCPATSSISHNPRYIKQDMVDDGEYVQNGKPRKTHKRKQRKRMTLKDADDLEFSNVSHYGSKVDVVHVVPDVEENVTNHDKHEESEAVEERTTELLLSSLLDKAERLQQQFQRGSTKARRRKRSGDSKLGVHHQDDKSHIVYLPTSAAAEPVDKQSDSHPPKALLPVELSTHTESTRVLLPKEDVTMDSLTECFGQKYFEAACRPRKFVLDVTDNVREVMKKCGVQPGVAAQTESALSFLVFVHDGCYDDESDVYKVFLNSRLRHGLLAIQPVDGETQDLLRSTALGILSHAMDFVAGKVAELQEEKFFPTVQEAASAKTGAYARELKQHLAAAEVYTPSVQRVFRMGSDITNVVAPSLAEMLDEEPAFCDVCYDDISPLTLNCAPATALLKCRHRVCDACWGQHVNSRLHQGFARVTCPGYDCQTEVGVGVMLSITSLDVVDKLLQRQEEVRIGASQTEKWCPGDSCGRVLRLQLASAPADRDLDESELQQDVVCACGAHVCFRCLEPAHWPASCKQAEEYRQNIATAVFPNRADEVHDDSKIEMQLREQLKRELEAKKTVLVEGKHCPKCKTFVYKDGGCPNMMCRCGQVFCWFCAKPGFAHYSRNGACVDEAGERKITTTIAIRHIDHRYAEESAAEKKQQEKANRRQKVSLMERAAEHRERRQTSMFNMTHHAITTLAKVVSTAASKDPSLAQHIINTCSTSNDSSTTSGHSHSSAPALSRPLTPSSEATRTQHSPSLVSLVTTFLRSAYRSKQEVHEVAEYTLVLVKDLQDSLLRRRALRVAEDLTAFCTFTQSIFDSWGQGSGSRSSYPAMRQQEAVKAIMRLKEIQHWIHSALSAHVTTVKKLRSLADH